MKKKKISKELKKKKSGIKIVLGAIWEKPNKIKSSFVCVYTFYAKAWGIYCQKLYDWKINLWKSKKRIITVDANTWQVYVLILILLL